MVTLSSNDGRTSKLKEAVATNHRAINPKIFSSKTEIGLMIITTGAMRAMELGVKYKKKSSTRKGMQTKIGGGSGSGEEGGKKLARRWVEVTGMGGQKGGKLKMSLGWNSRGCCRIFGCV